MVGRQGKDQMLSSDATLTTLPAAGVFISHHAQVQQQSVFDCQGVAAVYVALSARQGSSQAVWGLSKGESLAPAPALRPEVASQLPKLMHWINWNSAMALNRLSGHCGHFWEARYYATAIAPKDHGRVLNTLRYIHANPKAAGVRKDFSDPHSNYGHYGRLECDGISEWHPSFLQLASTLKGCSTRYQYFCQQYRHHANEAPKCHWGSRMLRRLVETCGSNRSKRKKASPGQQQLPFVFDIRLNQIPEGWHQVAERLRRANGIRDGDYERSNW
jgi:hypothetical protein